MFWVFLNFIWIFLSSYCIGLIIVKLIEKIFGRLTLSLDLQLMLGLMGLTVYAETFSLFYHLGILATLLLLVFCLIIAGIFRKEWMPYLSLVRKKTALLPCLLVFVLICMMTALGAQRADFYDSSLYHAQAIRWLEYYGAVPGLGNLHMRLAYNSAFLCLQALFSWHTIAGTSLHSMNAYLALMMILTALNTLKTIRERKVQISDMIAVLGLLFVVLSFHSISSPNTDFYALFIVWYLFLKWFQDLWQEHEEANRTALGILAVFGVTVKLSIAALALFVLWPAVSYIKKKQWRKLLLGIGISFLTVLPFLVRNVILSGYLLYPYAAIDLFTFDWKMKKEILIGDQREIMAWGRSLNDVAKYDYPLTKWFPIWFLSQTLLYRIMVVVNAVLLPITLIALWKQKREAAAFPIVLACLCLFTWLFTAPLIRYGRIYLFLLPAVWTGKLLAKVNRGFYATAALTVLLLAGIFRKGLSMDNIPVIMPEGYMSLPVNRWNWKREFWYIFQPIRKWTEQDTYASLPHPEKGLLKIQACVAILMLTDFTEKTEIKAEESERKRQINVF